MFGTWMASLSAGMLLVTLVAGVVLFRLALVGFGGDVRMSDRKVALILMIFLLSVYSGLFAAFN
ncbi:hypothetical protein PCCS19_20960 [Paenibacillus sp. CCS19]|nr:hypothetical protein PCCS19_20960 [Paenibacillus cellulosilyticus]